MTYKDNLRDRVVVGVANMVLSLATKDYRRLLRTIMDTGMTHRYGLDLDKSSPGA
jgi:hypothetical protein